jgi:hypothetical protein
LSGQDQAQFKRPKGVESKHIPIYIQREATLTTAIAALLPDCEGGQPPHKLD